MRKKNLFLFVTRKRREHSHRASRLRPRSLLLVEALVKCRLFGTSTIKLQVVALQSRHVALEDGGARARVDVAEHVEAAASRGLALLEAFDGVLLIVCFAQQKGIRLVVTRHFYHVARSVKGSSAEQ